LFLHFKILKIQDLSLIGGLSIEGYSNINLVKLHDGLLEHIVPFSDISMY